MERQVPARVEAYIAAMGLVGVNFPEGNRIIFIVGFVLLGVVAVLVQLGFTIRDLVREHRRR